MNKKFSNSNENMDDKVRIHMKQEKYHGMIYHRFDELKLAIEATTTPNT